MFKHLAPGFLDHSKMGECEYNEFSFQIQILQRDFSQGEIPARLFLKAFTG